MQRTKIRMHIYDADAKNESLTYCNILFNFSSSQVMRISHNFMFITNRNLQIVLEIENHIENPFVLRIHKPV